MKHNPTNVWKLLAGLWLSTSVINPVMAETLYQVYTAVAQHHPQLQIAQDEIDIARYQKKQAFGDFLPSVDVTSIANRSENNLDYEKYELSVRQPLFDLNSWYLNDRQYYNQNKVALEQQLVRNQLILSVADLFTQGLIAKQYILLSQEQLLQSKQLLEKAELSERLGAGSDLDIQRAKSDFYASMADAIEAKNRYQLSLLNLSRLAQQPITSLDVKTPSISPQDQPPQASEMTTSFDRYWQQTLEHNHTIQKEVAELNMTRSELKSKRAQYWPKIDIVGSVIRQENHGVVTDQLRHSEDTTIALEFTWNLFQGFKTNAAVDEQHAVYRKTKATQQDARLNLKQQVQQLVAQIYNNQQQYKALQNSIHFREQSYAQAHKKWALGMEDFSNVQKEKVDLFLAKRQAVELNYSTWLNYLELKSTAGTLTLDDLKHLTASLDSIAL